MTPEQSLQLCRLAKAAFPQQAVDEFTPDAWALALEDDRFEDAKLALKQLMREQPFMHVSELIARIKRIRRDRVLDFGPLPDPPDEAAEDPRVYAEWFSRTMRAIADGEPVERPALPAPGDRPDIDFNNVLPSVPSVDA